VLSLPKLAAEDEDSGAESESEWESEESEEEEDEEEEEGQSSDSGLGSQGSGHCPRQSRECNKWTGARDYLERGPYDPTPLACFSTIELEVRQRCREWVTRITDPASRVVHELQEQYGKMVPDLSEEEYSASKVTEEEKVLQLVGERDSKGQPHGEVEIYYANGDYFWGDCVGVKEGLASVVLANGDNLMGRFRNGQLEGLVTETLSFCDRDNVSREVFYHRGVRHGFYREFGPGKPGGKPGSRQFWAIGRFQGGRKVGHHWKCCHSFKPNAHFAQFWHPMYGLTMSIVASRDLVAGEEVFVSYNYALEKAPEWYQAIWFAHLRDDEGLSEQEIYEWCVRNQRRSGMLLEVPDPPASSTRNNPCGSCSKHVGCSIPSIACNSCNTWFHISCTQVDLEVVEKQAATRSLAATFTWSCPACLTDPPACHLTS